MAQDEEEHAIGYKVVPRGTPVEASDGTRVGTVVRTLDNVREHIFDGIVVKTDDGRRFVDAPEVARITNRRVVLTIDAAAARALPPHKGVLGSIENRAQRRANRLKRRFER